jgi:transposase
MSLHPRDFGCVPDETVRVAQAAFPKGNAYLALRNALGALYADELFAPLFVSPRGRPAESPGGLAVVTVLQFAENLSDRQAADAVRGRIDWKYLLGLELTDPGFDYSLLSDLRARVVAGSSEAQLLDALLAQFKARQVLKARGRQRTDSTHVLAAIHQLNRLEAVGETLRAALNSLAVVAPDWLRAQADSAWFERYGARFEQWRLPATYAAQQDLGVTIGRDGYHLLHAVYGPSAPAWLWQVPAVQVLRQVWVQQYYVADETVRWRAAEELPPNARLIVSPYDPDARNSVKRDTEWTGYKVHLTETCEDDLPNLITHVETTPSTTPDVLCSATIHQHLADKDLLPSEHWLDRGYVDTQALVDSRNDYGIALIGPVPAEQSWQARAGEGFAVSCFLIDWEAHVVTCPQGQRSRSWSPSHNQAGQPVIHVHFAKQDCLSCAHRAQCTRSPQGPRTIKLQPQERQEALQEARQHQQSAEFKEQYKRRAGIEGTISQGTRVCALRRSRYKGLSKTHLQHVLTAVAINLVRFAAWLEGKPRAVTRCSSFAALAPA